jgi:hypothetical protein
MKTENLYYLITVLSFSLLFYRQDAGINFIIFAGLLLLFSGLMNKITWKKPPCLIIAAGTVISSFFIVWYGNGLTIAMCIISLLLLMTIQKSKKSSYPVALAASMISVFGSVIFMILGRLDAFRLKQYQKTQPTRHTNKWRPVVIVALVAFLFLSLYRAINPIFDAYFSGLIGDINWGWIFFSLFGAILLYTFFYRPRLMRMPLKIENKYGKTITEDSLKPYSQSWFRLFTSFENERYSAFLLFVILNLLLLFLNIIDVHYLLLKGELPRGITYSDYVHSGVGAVILSIMLAIAVISYYFRGHINFDNKSKYIKALTSLWILQNIVLILMAALKNQLYIDAYSLTFMRIGVHYYLAFSVMGLLLTLYKIYSRKDTWFLFRSTSFGIYIALILSCVFNWNTIVTRYNLNNSKEVDYCYLNSLGSDNYPLLWERNYYGPNKKHIFELHLTEKTENYELPEIIGSFLKDYESTGIQSFCIAREKTYQYFVQLAKSNKLTFGKDSLLKDSLIFEK